METHTYTHRQRVCVGERGVEIQKGEARVTDRHRERGEREREGEREGT